MLFIKGETCKTNSVGCGFKEDRCLRINYKVSGNESMTDERCYQSSSCSNTAEMCNLVKKNGTVITDCKPTCCGKPNCNAVVEPDNSDAMPTPSSILIGIFASIVFVLKI